MTKFYLIALTLLYLGTSAVAHAQAPVVSLPNIFRDYRGQNDVNVGAGDKLQFGAQIQGGSISTTVKAQFTSNSDPSQNVTTPVVPCGPLVDNANFCGTSAQFSTARTNGTWKATFTNGSGSTTVTLPSVAAIPAAIVPFPINVATSSDSNGTPTITWTVPAGTVLNNVRAQVYDKSQRRTNGADQIIESVNLSSSATSYTPTVALTTGGNYSLNLQFLVSRDGGPLPANSSNADILTRSNAWFDFTKTTGAAPAVQLPQVAANNVFQFSVTNVGPSVPTLIDPPIAIGYDYKTAPGDPNFTSVLLPAIGNSNYTVTYQSASGQVTTVPLAALTTLSFPNGGVSAFSVRGIDQASMLDPTNAGSFVTTLTFASNGSFSGSMTPATIGNALVAATLPSSRSVQVGNAATAFATMINSGITSLSGCYIVPAVNVPAGFSYQTTNPATNALVGTINTPATIAAGAAQTFVVAFTPTSPLTTTDVPFGFTCTSTGETVPTIVGVNTLQLTFDANPVPDIVALAATSSNDGIVDISQSSTVGSFAVATANVGVAGAITVSADTGATTLPISLSICQTNANGVCQAPPSSAVTTSIAANDTPTFSIFIAETGTITLDPATKRIFVRFKDSGGIVRGSTSVAVLTTTP